MGRSHSKNGRRKDSKEVFKWKLLGGPRTRWTDVVQRDALQLLGIRGWRRKLKIGMN